MLLVFLFYGIVFMVIVLFLYLPSSSASIYDNVKGWSLGRYVQVQFGLFFYSSFFTMTFNFANLTKQYTTVFSLTGEQHE